MINLSKVPYFSNPKRLNRLKDFLSRRDDFMVHELAVATGCSLDDALKVCILIWHFRVAEIYVLLNRLDLSSNPIYTAKLSDGPPALPFYSEDNDVEIESLDNVSYEFHFVLFADADFTLYA
jgi:hypothetical protein